MENGGKVSASPSHCEGLLAAKLQEGFATLLESMATVMLFPRLLTRLKPMRDYLRTSKTFKWKIVIIVMEKARNA